MRRQIAMVDGPVAHVARQHRNVTQRHRKGGAALLSAQVANAVLAGRATAGAFERLHQLGHAECSREDTVRPRTQRRFEQRLPVADGPNEVNVQVKERLGHLALQSALRTCKNACHLQWRVAMGGPVRLPMARPRISMPVPSPPCVLSWPSTCASIALRRIEGMPRSLACSRFTSPCPDLPHFLSVRGARC